MKSALIDTSTIVKYLSSWTEIDKKWLPVYTPIANSARVAEVSSTSFPVAAPLFWVTCDDAVVADSWYYDTVTKTIIKIPDPAPYPVPPT
jgi:hypothetical protein